MSRTEDPQFTPLAIVGMSCLFPGADGIESYWASIREARVALSDIPPTHWSVDDYFDADPSAPDRTYARRGGFLAPVEFDPLEFGIAPRDLEATDSSQLLGLLVARRALQDAGYADGRAFDRRRVSVILGVTGTLELVIPLGARLGHPIWREALTAAGVDPATREDVVRRISERYVGWQENSFPGLLGNVVAGRIASRLDLWGTNCVVDAACASSLSALHLAGLELAAGRSDLVVTGGVDTFNDIFMYMCFSKTPALSPTGSARPFDRGADGTILGEGIGMLVLKRLADAERDGDRIHAVVRGLGSSSDGKGNAIYAPSAAGQARALRAAYEVAGVTPDTIELVEAHGTGTVVGDATEVRALTEVYRAARPAGTWCALGSVKSQIGHTKAAAGVAGIIKAALALERRVLPPTAQVEAPPATLAPGSTPFYVNTLPRPWLARADHARRAAVSSFGFGGSNFHLVLEEAPNPAPLAPDHSGSMLLLAFAAPERAQLVAAVEAASAELPRGDARAVAAASRAQFAAVLGGGDDDRAADAPLGRLVVVTPTTAVEAVRRLKLALRLLDERSASDCWQAPEGIYFGRGAPPGTLALVFAGQGSQYVGMLRELACRFPAFQDELAAADEAYWADRAARDERRLSDFIYPHPAFDDAARAAQEDALRDTRVAQPALGAVELGLLRVLEHFGVEPHATAGHSYGELAALHAAGRIEARDLHALSNFRGRLMGAGGRGEPGSMLAVHAPLDLVERVLAEHRLDLVIANRNAPRQAVLSGRSAEIDRATAALARLQVRTVRLPVAAAFHSPLVSDASAPFGRALARVRFEPGRVPVYGNTHAQRYPVEPDAARALLAGQLARPVEFVTEVERMVTEGVHTFLEVGPGARLTGLVGAILGDRPHAALALDASSGRRAGLEDLARALGQLAALGYTVDLRPWDAGYQPKARPEHRRFTVQLTGANHRAPGVQGAGAAAVAAHTGSVDTTALPASGVTTGAVTHSAVPTRAMPTKAMSTEAMSTEAVRAAGLFGRTMGHAPIAAGQPAGTSDARPSSGRCAFDPTPASGASCTPPASRPAAQSSRPAAGTREEISMSASGSPDPAPAALARVSPARVSPPSTQPHAALPSSARDAALRLTQENITHLARMQEQTARIHEQFLIGQQQALASLQALMHAQRAVTMGEATPQAVAAEPARRPAPPTATVVTAAPPSATMVAPPAPSTMGAPAMTRQIPPMGSAETAGTETLCVAPGAPMTASSAPPPSAAGPAREVVCETLLAVVSEKTGYPAEMLGLDMQLDADLGIDSIKRVEILSALAERLPAARAVAPEELGRLGTLNAIVEHLSQAGVAAHGAGPDTAPAPAVPSVLAVAHGAPTTAGNAGSAPGVPASGSGLREVVQAALLAVVSEKTGYPAEMLGLDMQLDADLGIDSIKRVEILSALAERLPAARAVAPEELGRLGTLSAIVEHLAGSPAPSPSPLLSPASLPASSPASNPPPSSVTAPGPTLSIPSGPTSATPAETWVEVPQREAIHAALLAVVSEKTGYPAEMLGLDMQLDADLGIDSIKRVEILSSLAERLPAARAVAPEELGRLGTLSAIVEHLLSGAAPLNPSAQCGPATADPCVGAGAPQGECTADRPTSGRSADAPPMDGGAPPGTTPSQGASHVAVELQRSVVVASRLGRPPTRCALALPEGAVFWVNEDAGELARRVARRLDALGYRAELIALEAAVENRPTPPADLRGLVLIAPRAGVSEDFLWRALRAVQDAAPALRAHVPGSDGVRGATCVTLARLDGAFGFGEVDPLQDPASAGLTALAKTVAAEWPEVAAKALDVARDLDDLDELARLVVEEALLDGPLEVGLGPDGQRTTLELLDSPQEPAAAPPLEPGDLVIASGGGRGVTAACLVELARACRPAIVLLGRTTVAEVEDSALAGLDGAALQRTLLTTLPAGTSPRRVRAEVDAVLAAREIRTTLGALRAAGAEVLYECVDVSDAAAVRALVARAVTAHGPVRALIHGAGVLADQRLEDKTHAAFQRVLRTKVDGARALLAAIDPEALRCLVFFSSSTARFGRSGQVDYAMANEILNKLAQARARALPTCRVLAAGWGPWEGGMVAPELARLFAAEGVGLIPQAAGARFLIDELGQRSERPVEIIVLGPSPIGTDLGAVGDAQPAAQPDAMSGAMSGAMTGAMSAAMLGAVGHTAGGHSSPSRHAARRSAASHGAPGAPAAVRELPLAFERTVDLATVPVLADHVLDGRAVLPAALAIEWLTHGAIHRNPGLVLQGFDDLRVLRGATLAADENLVLAVHTGPARREGEVYRVPVELRSTTTGRTTVHYGGTVLLGAQRSLPPAPQLEPLGPVLARTPAELYRVHLFHGPRLHAIEALEACGPAGITARLAAAPAPGAWLARPLRPTWLGDPLALDGAFQLCIVWCQEQLGMGCLPCAVGRARLFAAFPTAGTRCSARIERRGPQHVSAVIEFTEVASGALIARLEGVECVADASLARAFARRQLEPRQEIQR